MRSRTRWSGRTLVALVMGGLLLAGLPGPALASPIRGGLDHYRAFPGSLHSFTPNDIPSGFFDTGSAPFVGTVILTGMPLDPANTGSADTIVRRLETARFPHPFPSSDTVPIEIVALSLRSLSPITVTYAGGRTESWDVRVSLTSGAQPVGNMTITHTDNGGGKWEATLPVLARYTFIRRTDGRTVMLDETREDLIVQGVSWEHGAPKNLIISNRFCSSCQGDVGEAFTYLASTGTRLDLEPAFP